MSQPSQCPLISKKACDCAGLLTDSVRPNVLLDLLDKLSRVPRLSHVLSATCWLKLIQSSFQFLFLFFFTRLDQSTPRLVCALFLFPAPLSSRPRLQLPPCSHGTGGKKRTAWRKFGKKETIPPQKKFKSRNKMNVRRCCS